MPGGLCFRLVDSATDLASHKMIEDIRPGRRPDSGNYESKAVSGIEDVTISAHLGQRLVPLPEGSHISVSFLRGASRQKQSRRHFANRIPSWNL
jgi:hypothetical protein